MTIEKRKLSLSRELCGPVDEVHTLDELTESFRVSDAAPALLRLSGEPQHHRERNLTEAGEPFLRRAAQSGKAS
jgi:hypothetical protein